MEYNRRYQLFLDLNRDIEEALLQWLEHDCYCMKHCKVEIYWAKDVPNTEIYLEDMYANDGHLDDLFMHVSNLVPGDVISLHLSLCAKTSEDDHCVVKQHIYDYKLEA